jgi:hypothetical protein
VTHWPDITVQQFAELAMAKSFTKKLVDDRNMDAGDVAVAKFLQCNSHCENFVLRPRDMFEEYVIGETRQLLYSWWHLSGSADHSTLVDCLTNGRTGPGAALLASGHDFYSKLFAGRISTTSEGLFDAYERAIRHYLPWHSADKLRQAKFGRCQVVEGSKLSLVPKQKDTDRVICIEPNLNMFYQLGIGRILEDLLVKVVGIDLSTQPDKNRALALIGSETGRFSTIDLQSASDTIAYSLVKEIMPKGLVTLISMTRSPVTKLPDGSSAKLHMVSSMGNGFTFPLQTMLFCAVVLSVYKLMEHSLFDKKIVLPARFRLGNFGVFGDDIIVEGNLYSRMVSTLELFGFKVNTQKSFNQGPFRESCGSDYFNGQNVRGVYLKTLKTEQALYSAINRVRRWSLTWNRCETTLRYLRKYVRTLEVPLWESDDAGLQVPFSSLQRRRKLDRNGTLLYKRWVPRPVVLRVNDEDVVGPRKRGEVFFNENGLYLTFLAGFLRRYQINIRHDVVRYSLKEGKAPAWDLTYAGDLPLAGRN